MIYPNQTFTDTLPAGSLLALTVVGNGLLSFTSPSGIVTKSGLTANASFGPFQTDQLYKITCITGTIDFSETVADGANPLITAATDPLTGAVTGLVGPGGAISAYAFIPPSGDTTGVKDRTAIQEAINNLPSTGGEVRLSAGVFYIGGEITVTKPVKITGAGGGIAGDAGTVVSVAPTTINVTSQTANGFNVSASGCTFRDFALVNTYVGTPTAGAGILSTSNTTTTIDSLTVLGFWNLLDLGGVYYSVTNCRLYDGVNYYVYLHSPGSIYDDHGDMVIANNVLSGWKKSYSSVAQLRWESGGGLKVLGNKFNSGGQPGNGAAGVAAYAIQILVADGITTGSFVITGNSISGWASNTCNVYVGLKGPSMTGRITNILIVGNEIPVGAQGITLEGGAAHDDAIRGVSIANNLFAGITGSAIKVRYVRQCQIGENSHQNVGSPIIDIPDLTANCIAMRIGRQNFGEVASKVVVRDNRSIGNTTYALSGGVEYDYTHGLNISTVSTWTQVFKIEITNSISVKVQLDIDARSADSGNTAPNRKGLSIRQQRSFDVTSAGAVTASTIGTDYSAGAASAFAAVRYVITTNWVGVEVQTTDVTNCVLWGMARLRVDGKLQTFQVGP